MFGKLLIVLVFVVSAVQGATEQIWVYREYGDKLLATDPDIKRVGCVTVARKAGTSPWARVTHDMSKCAQFERLGEYDHDAGIIHLRFKEVKTGKLLSHRRGQDWIRIDGDPSDKSDSTEFKFISYRLSGLNDARSVIGCYTMRPINTNSIIQVDRDGDLNVKGSGYWLITDADRHSCENPPKRPLP